MCTENSLEIEVPGKLEIARSVGNAPDGAERSGPRRPSCVGTVEEHMVPGIEAVSLKHKRLESGLSGAIAGIEPG